MYLCLSQTVCVGVCVCVRCKINVTPMYDKHLSDLSDSALIFWFGDLLGVWIGIK